MNVGILTPSDTNVYASALLAKLVAQGNRPGCVICAGPSRVRTLLDHVRAHGFRGTARRVLQRWDVAPPGGLDVRQQLHAYLLAERITDGDRPLSTLCRQWSIEFLRVPGANAPETVQHVKSRNIDVLLNTGGEILRKDVIRSPALGILNAHMAPLPSLRGMNVLEWSLFEGRSIGVTLHFIDEGIDTGGVLLFREIPVVPGDTVSRLRAKSIVLNVELLAEGVRLLEGRRVQVRKQSQAEGKQYFVMHPRLRSVAERKLRQRWAQAAPTGGWAS